LRLGLPGLVAAASFAALTGCSTYDFSAARADTGGYRIAPLVEALEESESGKLLEWTWFPFAYTDIALFAAESDEGYPPDGYALMTLEAFLPFFCFAHSCVSHVDEHSEVYEAQELDSFFWGLVTHHSTRVATLKGVRTAIRTKVLFGLLGPDEVYYERDDAAHDTGAEAASEPAEPQTSRAEE